MRDLTHQFKNGLTALIACISLFSIHTYADRSFVTTNIEGIVPNDNLCGLEEAILTTTENQAQYGCDLPTIGSENDTIYLAQDTYTLSSQIYIYIPSEVGGGTITIMGVGPDKSAIQVGQEFSGEALLYMAAPSNASGSLNLVDLTLRGDPSNPIPTLSGVFMDNGCCSTTNGLSLDVIKCVITGFGNSGIRATETNVHIWASAIEYNSAPGDGGGVYMNSPSLSRGILVFNSTFAHNMAGNEGGGFFFLGGSNSRIHNSTFSDNEAAYGGGLHAMVFEYLEVHHSTFTNNRATVQGGGIWADDPKNPEFPSSKITIKTSIIGENTAPLGKDLFGYIGWLEDDLVGDLDGSFPKFKKNNIIGEPSLLNPLAHAGGSPWLQVHVPMANSPAIDYLPNFDLPSYNPPELTPQIGSEIDTYYDQRGFRRPADSDGNFSATADLGSVELIPFVEAEDLQVASKSDAADYTIINSSDYSNNQFAFFDPDIYGDQVTYQFEVRSPGLYYHRPVVRTGPDRGIYSVAYAQNINGPFVNVGAYDLYSPTREFLHIDMGLNEFGWPMGAKYIRFQVLGKNSASTDNRLNLDYIYIAGINIPGLPIPIPPLVQANFDTDSEGFSYADNLFRGAQNSNYASGTFESNGGLAGGGLQTMLGGLDGNATTNMSGGWQQSFTLSEPQDLTLTFSYKLTQSPDYESDEYSEALLSLNGELIGLNGNDYIHRVSGNGEGGGNVTSGWQTVTLGLGTYSPGSHSLALGGYNNKKTASNEFTTIQVDNVKLEGATPFVFSEFGDKTYELKFLHSSFCLDAFNTTAGSNVGQWSCHGSENQQWQFINVKKDYYQLVDVRDNLCLEVKDGSTFSAANIQVGNCDASDRQLFTPVDAGNGTYSLQSKNSGLLLDVDGGSQDNGANVIQYSTNGQDNQKLIFTEVGDSPDTGFVCEGACLSAEPLAPETNAVLNTTDERWYVVSEDLDGWQASEMAGRTIQVNGVTVSPGEMPLPPRVDGNYYFHFSAGDHPWASWGYWNW